MTGRARVCRALALLFLAVPAVVAGPQAAAPAVAATSRAVVVVDYQGSVHTTVIEFSGSLTGLQALTNAGADPKTIPYGSLGEAVCKLYGAGDPEVPGECPGGWTYHRSVGGSATWSTSGLGASNTLVHDGDVEGWRYGGGRPGSSARFCDHVPPCAPPPTEPSLSTPGSVPGAGGSSNGSPAAATGPGGTAAPAPAATIPPAATTEPTATTNADERSTGGSERAKRSASTRRSGDDGVLALGADGSEGDGGSGSPAGVLIVVGVLVAVATAVALQRQRRRARAPGPST
jgi:hypothetical protein